MVCIFFKTELCFFVVLLVLVVVVAAVVDGGGVGVVRVGLVLVFSAGWFWWC